MLWLLDPSLLTAVSSVGLIVTLLDYLVPTVSASLYSPAHWTGAMEKQYEDICKALVHSYNVTTQQVFAFLDLKVSSPKLVTFSDQKPFHLLEWIIIYSCLHNIVSVVSSLILINWD